MHLDRIYHSYEQCGLRDEGHAIKHSSSHDRSIEEGIIRACLLRSTNALTEAKREIVPSGCLLIPDIDEPSVYICV